MDLVEEYVRLYAMIAADRGCEGNLISYYHTLPVYIAKIKSLFGLGQDSAIFQVAAGDGPPPPAI
ncbi:MAG TPA: hypothetical protein VGE40_06740 [Bacilli bacterium]